MKNKKLKLLTKGEKNQVLDEYKAKKEKKSDDLIMLNNAEFIL